MTKELLHLLLFVSLISSCLELLRNAFFLPVPWSLPGVGGRPVGCPGSAPGACSPVLPEEADLLPGIPGRPASPPVFQGSRLHCVQRKSIIHKLVVRALIIVLPNADL